MNPILSSLIKNVHFANEPSSKFILTEILRFLSFRKVAVILSLFLSTAFFTNSANAQLSEGLLLQYNLDGNFEDASGNDFDGAGFNFEFGEDYLGNPESALIANGVNTYVEFPDEPSLKPGFPITMAVRAKFDYLGGTQIIAATDFGVSTHSGAWFQISSANEIAVAYGNAQGGFNGQTLHSKRSDFPVEIDTWYSIVVIIRGYQDIDIYVDCELQDGYYSGNAQTIGYTDATGSLCRKRGTPDSVNPPYYLGGGLDGFRYWNRALDENEVIEACLDMEPFDCPSLAANFNDTCDDGNDQTDNDLVTENCECVGTPIDDGICSDYSAFYVNHGDGISGSELYALSFTETEANLSFLTSVDFEAHIAYNASSQIVYIVDATGVVIKRYDVSSGPYLPDLELNPAQGVMDRLLAAVYNPADSLLYVGDDNDKKIYTINLSSGEALFYANADVKGGDLAFQNGKLYLATRSNAKLYEIVEGEDPIELGSIDTNVNGMASGSEGNALITAHFNTDSFLKINSADGSLISAYPALLDGLPYILLNGDMASGCGDGLDTEEPDSGTCYADVVVEYVEGLQANNSPLPLNRANPDHALGEPEGSDSFVFTTLGYGGSITFSFDGVVPNGPGDDIEVVETSFGNPGCDAYPEFADVLVSQNGVDYFLAKTVCKSDKFVDISDAGAFENVSFIKIGKQ